MSPRYVAFCFLSCFLLSLLPGLAPATEGVGRVLMAAGDTTAIRGGRVVRLARGSLIEPKDLLRTGRDSSLQVRMTDSGILSLRADSSLAIEQYVYRGQPDGNENAVFRLLRGGFRTITGLIGRVNKSAYRVNTGVATIGIRGTAYALALCDAGACQSGSGSSAADGLYGTVTEGQITAANQVAETTFKAGDTFFAAAPDSQFQRLLAPPPFLAAQVSRQKPNEKESAEDDGPAATNDGGGSGTEQQAGQRSKPAQDGGAERRPAQTTGRSGPARQSEGQRGEKRAAAIARRIGNGGPGTGREPGDNDGSDAAAGGTSPDARDTTVEATTTTTTSGQSTTETSTTLKLTDGSTSITTDASATITSTDGTTAVTTDTSTTLKLADGTTSSVTTGTSTTLLSTSPTTTTIAPLTTTAPTVISTETISSTGALSVLPAPDGFLVAYPHPGATFKVHFGDATEGQFTTANFLSRFFFATTDAGDLGAGNVVNKGSVAVGDQVITWGRWNGAVVATPQGPVNGIPVLFVTANGVSGNSTAGSTPFPATLGSVTYVGGLGPQPSAVMPGFAPNQVIGSVSNESLQINFLNQTASLAMDMAFSASDTTGATFSRAYAVSGIAVPNSASTNAGDLSGTLGVSCTSGCGGSTSANVSGSFNIGLTGPNGYEVAVTAGGISDTDASLSATFVRIFRAAP